MSDPVMDEEFWNIAILATIREIREDLERMVAATDPDED